MSVGTATWLSVASIVVAAILNIIGIGIVAFVTLKAARESSRAQAEIARQSWKAQEKIIVNDARVRWVAARLERMMTVISIMRDFAQPDGRAALQDWEDEALAAR